MKKKKSLQSNPDVAKAIRDAKAFDAALKKIKPLIKKTDEEIVAIIKAIPQRRHNKYG